MSVSGPAALLAFYCLVYTRCAKNGPPPKQYLINGGPTVVLFVNGQRLQWATVSLEVQLHSRSSCKNWYAYVDAGEDTGKWYRSPQANNEGRCGQLNLSNIANWGSHPPKYKNVRTQPAYFMQPSQTISKSAQNKMALNH